MSACAYFLLGVGIIFVVKCRHFSSHREWLSWTLRSIFRELFNKFAEKEGWKKTTFIVWKTRWATSQHRNMSMCSYVSFIQFTVLIDLKLLTIPSDSYSYSYTLGFALRVPTNFSFAQRATALSISKNHSLVSLGTEHCVDAISAILVIIILLNICIAVEISELFRLCLCLPSSLFCSTIQHKVTTIIIIRIMMMIVITIWCLLKWQQSTDNCLKILS